jgi:hypothetical protein
MIEWQQTIDPSVSGYHAEQALVGEFRLAVFDQPSDRFGPAKVIWGILGPPEPRVVLARGIAADVDAAKAAAEQALAALQKPG